MYTEKEYKRRQDIVQINSCNMKSCKRFNDGICTHLEDTVNLLGETSCPKLWDSIKRKDFRG